jgi:ketosteroid isomerase-like protein
MKNFFRLAIIASFVSLIAGCGMVSEKDAAAEFIRSHPTAHIYEQFIGEGDSDHAYMHFRYTEGNQPIKMEQMWVYQRQDDGRWKVIGKNGPKPPGSDFGD